MKPIMLLAGLLGTITLAGCRVSGQSSTSSLSTSFAQRSSSSPSTSGSLFVATEQPHMVGQVSQTVPPIGSIDFVATNAAFEISSDGRKLMFSSDGGSTWTFVHRFPQPINQLDMVTNQIGWEVANQCGNNGCTKGIVARTEDGGRTWVTVYTLPESTGPIDFISPDQGWLFAGQPGSRQLLHTTDGGKTWTKMASPTQFGKFISGTMCFITPKTGWLLTGGVMTGGYQGKALYITHNGGQSRTPLALSLGALGEFPSHQGSVPQSLPLAGYVSLFHFVNGQVGWAYFSRGDAFQTVDGGHTWRPVWTKQFPPQATNLTSFGFDTAHNGWVVSQDPNALWTTADRGQSWKQVSGAMPVPSREIQFLTNRKGIGSDAYGVMVTNDGGYSWTRLNGTPGTVSLNRVGLGQYWAVGSRYHLYFSADGGHIWEKRNLPNNFYVTQAAFWSIHSGLVTGPSRAQLAVVYHTSNGGATWVKMHWPFLPHFVTAPNEQDWWAISYTHNISRPYLYHTQDGGVHWKRYQVSSWNSDTYLLGINFVTPRIWLYIGESNVVDNPRWGKTLDST